MITFHTSTIGRINESVDSLPSPLNESLAIIPNRLGEMGNRLPGNLCAPAVEHTCYRRVEVNLLIHKLEPVVKFLHSIFASLHYLANRCRASLMVIEEAD